MIPFFRFEKMEDKKMPDIVTWILVVIMGIAGGLSSLYLLFSIPVILVWKIGRKIKYGYSMYD